MSTTKRQIIIDDDLWKAVKVRAATDGTSATNIVTTAVSSWLGTDFSNATITTTQGSEVRFAANTPPTQDLTDIRPKGFTRSVTVPDQSMTEAIVVPPAAGPRPTPPPPPPDKSFNTRPFTPVPKGKK